MTKEHEELVEELLKEECSTCKDHFKREDCLSGQENYCRIRMEKMLTLILSAVRDGWPSIEEIAALEHEQWMEWSKQVADEVSPETRARWETYWIPYGDLSEAAKEQDRIWARKVIALREEGKK